MQHHRRRGYGKEQPPFPHDLVDPLIKAGLAGLGRYIDRQVNAFCLKHLGPIQDKLFPGKKRNGGLK